MPFTRIPSPFYASNNRTSLRHPQFVSQAITKLLVNNCAEELKQKPCCCNPLMVVESKKLRLVLYFRHVNKRIKHNKARYENLSALSEMLNKGDYFTTFDLTPGYHHIEIHPEHRKFLGKFTVNFLDGLSMTVPLDTSNFVFCHSTRYQHAMSFQKFFGPSQNDGVGRDIKAIIYIDDSMTACRGFEIAESVSKLVRNDLLSAEFVINNKKSDFYSKTKVKWLGTIIDTTELTFTVPQEKIRKLLEDITTCLNKEFLTPKQLSKEQDNFLPRIWL